MPAEPLDRRYQALSVPYFDDPCEVYLRLRSLGLAALLDSGGDAERGRYDIIAAEADPTRELHIPATVAAQDLRPSLQHWLDRAIQSVGDETAGGGPEGLPFYGGYIGHLSYELGRRLQGLPAASEGHLPLAMVRYYPWAIVQDRKAGKSWLVAETALSDTHKKRIQSLLASPDCEDAESLFRLSKHFHGHWSLPAYARVFDRVKHYIAAGDCYQINIGQRFSAGFEGDLFAAYRRLRPIARAPFSAFLPLDKDQSLLCLSPERFLTVRGRDIETRPIKGTRPRYADPLLDNAAASELLNSEKERSENLMIVDLLRNDIGRFCEAGSVQAKALFRLESYATVHHLVSVVTGRLGHGTNSLELLLGCLPGGSITGAPKRRAMQIIDELEIAPRQAWCGTIFYLSAHGRMDSNISIRTLYSEDGQLHCWAGGGLVDDSRAPEEYQEQRDKVGAFLKALETFCDRV
jgi:para-aminobenzoate synthetase component 1